ncbi:hypothetical protein Pmani_002702 [Petrolisthes manimaculis]|uniref:Uncharacterized protein n=1 Tax=Petrolisthes manimaculis TaxID=1843537 RepID=A0AAE1QI12_9EUCA|nr:hypothetical protein Pmani_002702 [Petrolisthes manimaculis]
MRKQGLIRPSLSPWSSPVVLVPKPGATARTAPDTRGLPAETDSLGWKARAGDQWTQKYDEYTDLCTVNTFADTLISYATMWYQSAARNEEGSLYVDTLVDRLSL